MYNELTKSDIALRLYEVTDSLPGPGGCLQRPSMVKKKNPVTNACFCLTNVQEQEMRRV